MTTNRFPFPEPRYPDYLKSPTSIDDLLPVARKALERTTGRGALGLAKPGDKVLIVTPCSLIQDRLVVDAVLRAFRIGKNVPSTIYRHSFLYDHSIGRLSKRSS